MGKLLTTDSIERKRAILPNTIEESPRTGRGIAYSKRMFPSDTDCLNGQGSD